MKRYYVAMETRLRGEIAITFSQEVTEGVNIRFSELEYGLEELAHRYGLEVVDIQFKKQEKDVR